ncbi:MAG: hypothetical protein DSZ30_01765 [Aquificaceae bacterium]|nr:MAG: hypothetical protein DSZ30_01765 [Aquificaceae bacterium]
MPIKLVVFDLDGTLVDSMGLYAEKAGELIEKFYSIPKQKAKRLYFETSGLPFLEQLNVLFPNEREKNKRVAEIFEKWKPQILKNLKIFPEGVYAINFLKGKGILTAISSNNLQKYVEHIVKNSGVNPDFILGWDGKNFKKGKPHIDFLVKKTGIDRKEILMIGDSPNDYKLAKEGGVNFVAVKRHFSEEDFKRLERNIKILNSLKDLEAILKI